MKKPSASYSYWMYVDMRVAFVENHDSFSYNIISLMSKSGSVDVLMNDDRDIERKINDYTHIVIGPGPGNPSELETRERLPDMRGLQSITRNFQGFILGVCLGHQVIGVCFNAKIRQQRNPTHAKITKIRYEDSPIFGGCRQNFKAVLYNSLHVYDVRSPLKVIARSSANKIMAIEHENKRVFGIQFHPESALSEHGETIMNNFLSMRDRGPTA